MRGKEGYTSNYSPSPDLFFFSEAILPPLAYCMLDSTNHADHKP